MDYSLQNLFVNILNLSLTGTYVILFVLLIRLPLKKAPKVFSYSLWGAVLFRLISPYSFSAAFSLLKPISVTNSKPEFIPLNLGLMGQPTVDIGVNSANSIINSPLPATTLYASANPMQIILAILSVVWIVGVLIMALYSIASYLRLKKKIYTAILAHDNVFECEKIDTPFVLGILKPIIYLPIGLSENEKTYILKHEQIHIKRLDYLVKPFAFVVLCIHWFNPFVWLSFIMMSRDMEMSCDEKVIKELGNVIKRDYSASLLSMAVNRRLVPGSPLAFGESNIKNRIRNVLDYKKTSFWVVMAAAILVVVIGFGLISNPKPEKSSSELKLPSYLSNRTEYVGNASKVGGIIKLFTFPANVSYDHFELQTGSKPYGVTVYLKTDAGKLDEAMVSDDIQYQKNSLILFSLIGNADEIIYNLSDGIKSNTMQFSRAWANNTMNMDVWKASENQSDYSAFLNNLEHKFSVNINAETTGKNPSLTVEQSLILIMSSPLNSSNPNDYISAHQKEYENIIKYQGKDALDYMLQQFKTGNVKNDLRGQIMMKLCKELLGPKNNVLDDSLSSLEWYSKLNVKEQTALPDFSYQSNDPVLKLVYKTEIEKNQGMKYNGGFLIVAPHIHGSYEEGNELKVFVTTYSSTYNLYGKLITESAGGIVPTAITYIKNSDGSYSLDKYEQAKDGSYFGPSIKNFCTMPVSGKEITGLADVILKHYSNYDDILKLNTENLTVHLKLNKQMGVSQKTNSGNIVPLT